MRSQKGFPWQRVGVVAALLVLLCLIVEYIFNLGRAGFDATNHWLSEYVLSDSLWVVWFMKACFIGLGVAGYASGKRSREWHVRALFQLGAICLAAMAFLDTDPNDGRVYPMRFPPTHGNMHQLLLFVAMGATLIAIALRVFLYDPPKARRGKLEAVLFGAALSATSVQFFLSSIADANHVMTRFGGITERIIVVTIMAWVISFCLRD
jgi:hypothetical protein